MRGGGLEVEVEGGCGGEGVKGCAGGCQRLTWIPGANPNALVRGIVGSVMTDESFSPL